MGKGQLFLFVQISLFVKTHVQIEIALLVCVFMSNKKASQIGSFYPRSTKEFSERSDFVFQLQQTLKQHGVKLNAATYMYLNSMLLNAASLSNEQGPTKTRSRVRIHWVMVRCTAKFIILWRKKHGMSGTEAQENAESKELLPFSPEQTTGSNAYG